jgi:hypothetical protein
MIAILAAATLATLNPAQQADFDCLRVGMTVERGHRPKGPFARYFLRRLRRTDPQRNWLAEAKPLDDIVYEEFIHRIEICQTRMFARSGRSPR